MKRKNLIAACGVWGRHEGNRLVRITPIMESGERIGPKSKDIRPEINDHWLNNIQHTSYPGLQHRLPKCTLTFALAVEPLRKSDPRSRLRNRMKIDTL